MSAASVKVRRSGRQLFIPACLCVVILPLRHSFQRLLYSAASGYRERVSGALGGVGTNGYAWSSAPYASGNANAGNLNFNSTAVNPLNNNARANGFTVRCVQHLRGLFYLFPGFQEAMKDNLSDPEWPRPSASVSEVSRFSNPLAISVSYSSQPACASSSCRSGIQSSDCRKVASGNRNNTTGALNVVGTYGYSWSSSPYAAGSANVSILRFLASEMTPLNSNNRANAFPVRCVQHLRGCFLSFRGSWNRPIDHVDKKQLSGGPEWPGVTTPASEAL
ncbi:MAG: fibrobacter succinogenes major paralogous domain-containing protein [Alistipes sp.]|nr:fibrobacter succinogenes major paralogous domain-containing protein [Alistipes sp.]